MNGLVVKACCCWYDDGYELKSKVGVLTASEGEGSTAPAKSELNGVGEQMGGEWYAGVKGTGSASKRRL